MDKIFQTISFIRDLYNKPNGFIPLHEPVFIGNEKKYLNECIDSTYVSSVGKYVDLFEIEVAKYTNVKNAVVCVNGTNALHLALLLAGVQHGDEVITQPLTFIATVNAISYCGAKPIFIDIDKSTLGLSPSSLKEYLDKNTYSNDLGCFNKNSKKKISAVVPMHTFGHPCEIEKIAEICNFHNIELIEDAAESLGSFYKGKHTGTFGKIGVISFNGNKIITTGGGGILLFNDQELAIKAKHLSTQAKVPHQWEFVHDSIGYNYRMPNINAALGLAQLEQIEKFLISKRTIANKYKNFFDNIGISFVTEPKNSQSNYWLNSIVLESRYERDTFLRITNQEGIMTRPAWELMNHLKMFKSAYHDNLQNAEWISERLVNISSSAILL